MEKHSAIMRLEQGKPEPCTCRGKMKRKNIGEN